MHSAFYEKDMVFKETMSCFHFQIVPLFPKLRNG